LAGGLVAAPHGIAVAQRTLMHRCNHASRQRCWRTVAGRGNLGVTCNVYVSERKEAYEMSSAHNK
jgi:hypothetical protein